MCERMCIYLFEGDFDILKGMGYSLKHVDRITRFNQSKSSLLKYKLVKIRKYRGNQ